MREVLLHKCDEESMNKFEAKYGEDPCEGYEPTEGYFAKANAVELLKAAEKFTEASRRQINGDDGRFVHNLFCDLEAAIEKSRPPKQ